MRETREHTDAFNEYYLMGNQRSLKKLASSRKVSEKTAKKWSAEHDWQNRIALRDIELSRKEIERVDQEILNTKADYRKQINKRLEEDAKLDTFATGLIARAKESIETGKLKIETIKELAELMRAHQGSTARKAELMKLDLLLMGEDVDKGHDASINIHLDVMSDADRKDYFDAAYRIRAISGKMELTENAAT
jgi:hypothetical protein